MSLPELMPIEDLFAYDPSKAGDKVSYNESELECARAIVDQELSIRFDESALPEELVSLLNDAWKEVLAAIYIDEGFGSIRWILAMEITDELVWTLQPKKNLAERTKMISMLPTMVKVLRQGLEFVQWNRQQTESLFDSLSHHHMSVLRGDHQLGQQRQKCGKILESESHHGEDDLVGSSATGEKGWHYRADTNEWVYQSETTQQVAVSANNSPAAMNKPTTSRVRKVGFGDR